MTTTQTPRAETFDMPDLGTAIMSLTHKDTNARAFNIQNLENTTMIIEFRSFRLDSNDELYIYDSKDRLLASILSGREQVYISLLNLVISDSKALIEYKPYQSSAEYFFSFGTLYVRKW